MRSTIAASVLLASLIGIGTAGAAECPTGALGVSRTLVVDPSEHARLGSMQYSESLPLKDHEVVLTFDDGPLPPYTNRVLDTLASECVKATFFMVGRMVQAYPAVVRRVYNEGHTIANHSQTHPFTFHKMSVDQASQEIEGRLCLAAHRARRPQGGGAVLPHPRPAAAELGRAISRRAQLHDLERGLRRRRLDPHQQPAKSRVAPSAGSRPAAKASCCCTTSSPPPRSRCPKSCASSKPAASRSCTWCRRRADRPKTVTEPALWAVRHTAPPEPKIWPRTLVMGESPPPVLAAPSPASFGIEYFGPVIKVAMAQNFERQVAHDGDVPLPAATVWPRAVAYAVPADSRGVAGAGRAQFQVFPPVPIGPSGQTQVCGPA